MHKALPYATPLLLLTACVTENNVKPEDSRVVANYTCDDLQKKLVAFGVMRDKSSKDENRNSGQEVAGRFIPRVGAPMIFINQMNANGNTKRVKIALDVYYQAWDDRKCSQWLYEQNAAQK